MICKDIYFVIKVRIANLLFVAVYVFWVLLLKLVRSFSFVFFYACSCPFVILCITEDKKTPLLPLRQEVSLRFYFIFFSSFSIFTPVFYNWVHFIIVFYLSFLSPASFFIYHFHPGFLSPAFIFRATNLTLRFLSSGVFFKCFPVYGVSNTTTCFYQGFPGTSSSNLEVGGFHADILKMVSAQLFLWITQALY